MASRRGEALEEGAWCSPVPLTKRMDRVEFANMFGGAPGEFLARRIPESVLGVNGGEALLHLAGDMRHQTEHGAASGDVDGSILPGPVVEVLKDGTMDLAPAVWRERSAGWQGLHAVGRGYFPC